MKMHTLFYCIAPNLFFFWVGFEQTYPQSSFTHLGYSKTCFDFSLEEESKNFSSFPATTTYPSLGISPLVWLMQFGALHFSLSLSSLLPRTATERKCELSRLYLPPKSTSQGASFASLVTSSATILVVVPSNHYYQAAENLKFMAEEVHWSRRWWHSEHHNWRKHWKVN